MNLQDGVIVGAGMAGLACARRLQQAGYRVSVVEKSRGLGGRMATRRIEGVPIDHGARFLQPQTTALQALTHRWQARGLVTLWQPQTFYLDSTGQLNPDPAASPSLVAPDGMSALGKAIAGDLPIYRQQRVVAIAPEHDHWRLTAERSGNGESVTHLTRSLVLAMPAPQILPLLAPLRSHPGIADALPAIAAVDYAPCITVMAQYPPPTFQPHTPLPCDPTVPWMIEGHADTPFLWLGLDSSKRQTEELTVVLHSSATFAEHWLDADNLQAAGEALLSRAGKLIAPWLTQPDRWQVHRWRYALVERPCPDTVVTAATPLPWVACGDWGGDRAIDSALESGWAAAAVINQFLEQQSLIPDPAALLS